MLILAQKGFTSLDDFVQLCLGIDIFDESEVSKTRTIITSSHDHRDSLKDLRSQDIAIIRSFIYDVLKLVI